MNPTPRGTTTRILWCALVALLVVYVLRYPTAAAANAQVLSGWLASAADSIAVFLQQGGGGRS